MKYKLTLTTKRLELRPMRKSDYKKWKEAFSSIGPKKNRWDWEEMNLEDLTKEKFHKGLECRQKESKEDKGYHFGVFEKKSGLLVGYTMLMGVSRGCSLNAYIGYQLFTPFWGQGYGTEMVKATIKLAFNNIKLHRLEAEISPNNRRSLHLAKKAGFRKEGRLKRRRNFGNGWRDMMVYAITTEDL